MNSPNHRYKAWRPEHADEVDARNVLAHDPEGAAEAFAARECGDDPSCYAAYMDGVEVMVRSPNGNLDQIHVHAEQTVVFHTSGGR